MPIIWGMFNIDIPWTYGPMELTSDGPAYYANPEGGWEVGYRQSVYFKIANHDTVEKTLSFRFNDWDYFDPNAVNVEVVIPPAEEVVIEVPAEDRTTDFTRIDILGDSTNCTLLEIQLTPFASEVFWTNKYGVIETE